MSKIITNPKNYNGEDLTNIFFRPILQGPEAQNLGIRVLYNMPTPTVLNFWGSTNDILKSYTKGWQGGESADKTQKTLQLKKVKAEMSYSASDYFSMIYEKIACSGEINMTDLSGTELESAETEIFKNNIKEGLRSTFWIGNSDRTEGGFRTFDGIMKKITDATSLNAITTTPIINMGADGNADKLFYNILDKASPALRALKSEGHLVIFATSDIVENYEKGLYSGANDTARAARIDGIDRILYRGIPVEDMGISNYLKDIVDLPPSFAVLTDRRNIALAVNTRDMPGSEVAMWYNPDELENRQRATFLAAADFLLPELMVVSHTMPQ